MDNITTTTNIYLPKSFVNGIRKHVLKQNIRLEDIAEELPYVYRESRRERFVTEDKVRILRQHLFKHKSLFVSEVGWQNLVNTINTSLNIPLINQNLKDITNIYLPNSFVNSIKKHILKQNIRLEDISEELPYVYRETKRGRSVCKNAVNILLKDLDTNKHLFVSAEGWTNLVSTIHTVLKLKY